MRLLLLFPFFCSTAAEAWNELVTKRGDFNRQEPTQEYTSLLIVPNYNVTFYCSTTSPWFDCKWKHPIHKDPCGIFYTDPSKICHFESPNGG